MKRQQAAAHEDGAFTSPIYPPEYEPAKKAANAASSSTENKEASSNSKDIIDIDSDSIQSEDEPATKKRKTTKGKKSSTTTATTSRRRKKGGEDDEEKREDQAGATTLEASATEDSVAKNAELKITEKGTIEEMDEGNEDNSPNALTARGTPRLKRYIKRRLRRYLSLELKIAVFERIIQDTDPKTRKLRYGASNEICADFSIGRKTINNIKNLFERLLMEGKDLSSILRKEIMDDIPAKLNIPPDVISRTPLTADQISQAIGGGADDDDSEDDEEEKNAKKALASLKKQSALPADDDSSNAEAGDNSISKKVIAAAALAATNVTSKDSLSDAGKPENTHSLKYKTLYDEETRLRKMFKVNNVGRQTKLNDVTIERIRQIVPYCFGVKELSDMYEREFGEKIHQSTLWRYCSELNIKIPKKNAKK